MKSEWVMIFSLLVLLQMLYGINSQTCTCAQLQNCLATRRNTRSLNKAICRQNCTDAFGSIQQATKDAAVRCFQAYDAAKSLAKTELRTCMERQGARPCVGGTTAGGINPNMPQNVARHQPSASYISFRPRGRGRGRFGSRFRFNSGLPNIVQNYKQCTCNCARNADAGTSGAGGRGFGRPGGRGGPFHIRMKRYRRRGRSDYFQCAMEQNCRLTYGNMNRRNAYCNCTQQTNYTALFIQNKITLCNCLQPLFPNERFDCNAPRQNSWFNKRDLMCRNNFSGMFQGFRSAHDSGGSSDFELDLDFDTDEDE